MQIDKVGNASNPTTVNVTKDVFATKLGLTLNGIDGLDSVNIPVFNTNGTIDFKNLEAGAKIQMRLTMQDPWVDLGTSTSVRVADLGADQGRDYVEFRQVDLAGNGSKQTYVQFWWGSPNTTIVTHTSSYEVMP